jgi:hypothetical protein
MEEGENGLKGEVDLVDHETLPVNAHPHKLRPSRREILRRLETHNIPF